MKAKFLIFIICICFINELYSQEWRGCGFEQVTLVKSMRIIGDQLYVGGSFDHIGTPDLIDIANWDSTIWQPMGGGMNFGTVNSIEVLDGKLIAGGSFFDADEVPNTRNIAQWNGTNWQPVGNIGNPNGPVYALQAFDGKLYIGGGFGLIGNEQFLGIACFDGTNWINIGYVNGGVYTIAIYNNDLYIGGTFSHVNTLQVNGIARWDGQQWDTVNEGV